MQYLLVGPEAPVSLGQKYPRAQGYKWSYSWCLSNLLDYLVLTQTPEEPTADFPLVVLTSTTGGL